ncbi:MAG: polysulfide reductase NrfD [Desulfurococcales archaeon]|nr:polysulfide reductase NrfD [Desulfurococcales archaeon]
MGWSRLTATVGGVILVILFIVGIAMYRAGGGGEQALIPWGMMVVGYIFFALASGGVFDSMAIRLLRGDKDIEAHAGLLAWSSLALLAPGIVLVFSDVLHPGAAPYFYLSFNPESRIAWNAVLYLLYGGGLLAFTILVHLKGPTVPLARSIAAATLAFSLLLEANLGMAYAVNVAVPAWYASMAPILFIALGFAMGSGFTILTLRLASEGSVIAREYAEELRYTLLAAAFIAGWSLVGMAAWGDARTTVVEVVMGGVAPIFWLGFVLVGVLAPLAIASRRPPVAGLLAILGLAVYLAIPFNYTPQAARLKVNPFYMLLAQSGPVEAGLWEYVASPETLAFIGGLGVWLLLVLYRGKVLGILGLQG